MPDNTAKEEKKEPLFYHFNGKILQIKHASEEETKKHFLEKHDVFIKETDVMDAPARMEEMKAAHKNCSVRVFSNKECDMSCVWCVEGDLTDESQEKIESLLAVPVWDVTEYDSDGTQIVHIEGYQGKDVESVLSSLECLAKKPFQEGGTIKEAIDPDLRRRRLDSVIAEAQRLCEEDQKTAAMPMRRF